MPPSSVDRRFSVGEDHQGLILNDLLYFFPGPYIMLSAYLDESGTHGDSRVMCVAGLLYKREQMEPLDSEWKEALSSAGVRYFHAVESSQLRGEFKGWERRKEDQLYRKLVGIVKGRACGGAVAYMTSEEQFDEYRKSWSWEYGQYTTCVYACVRLLLDTAEKLDDGRVDLTIESGHKDMGEMDAFLRRLSDKGLLLTHGFRDKKDIRPLQTADLWAYEARKRVNDQLARQIPLNPETLPVLFEQVRNLLN